MSEPMWRRYTRLWGPNVRADVDDEIEFHLQTRADAYVRQGMGREVARARAVREFGDMARAKSECRDIGEEQMRLRRRAELRGVISGDVSYALRLLRRNPVFTTVAVLTLAMGIGATTILYSAIDAVLLRPLPFAASDRLVQIWEDKPGEDFGTHDIPTSPANFVDWRAAVVAIEEIGAFRFSAVTLTSADEAEQIIGLRITPSMFRVLGVEPVLGRTFSDADAEPGAPATIVITYGLWQRRFGGRNDVIGSVATLNGTPRTIVGVMPAAFRFPYERMFPSLRRARVEIYAPMVLDPAGLPRYSRALGVVGRLAESATLRQAQAELDVIHARLAVEYPVTNEGWIVRVVPLARQIAGAVRLELLVLFSAVSLLLLIACANVGNLLLARGITRHRELALRSALGAGRARLMRQLLTESVVLALIGGAAGLALAYLGVRSLPQVMPEDFPRLPEIAVNTRVALFALAAAVATGLLFGALPAMRAGGLDLRAALQSGGRTATTGRGARAATSSLIVFQVALAVMLLVGAGLLIRSFALLTAVRPGFRAERLVTGGVALTSPKYANLEKRRQVFEQIVERAVAVPGITDAALAGLLPFTESESFEPFRIDGAEPPPPGQEPVARFYVISPTYFETMGIPVLAGRGFTREDRAATVATVIVNQAMAHKFWPDQDAVGKRLSFLNDGEHWRTIVGVAGSVRFSSLDTEPQPEMYVPLSQSDWDYMILVTRTAREPAAIVPALRRAVAEVDRDLPLSDVNTMTSLIAGSLAQRRLNTLLLAGFAALAVVLSAIGLYGVLGQSVARRRQEIGVRLALGARPADALRLILRDGLVTIGTGALIGIAGALLTSHLLSRMLYGISSLDVVTFTAVPIFIVIVALFACYVPARRAMRVDPLTALRAD